MQIEFLKNSSFVRMWEKMVYNEKYSIRKCLRSSRRVYIGEKILNNFRVIIK